MISVAEAVVDERAVVIEVLYAPAASVAVERRLCFHDLVVGAEVIEWDLLLEGLVDD